MKYKVVYKGQYSKEVSKIEVANKLASVLDLPTDFVLTKILPSDSYTLIDRLIDEKDADAYLAEVLKSGIIAHKELDITLDMLDPYDEPEVKIVNHQNEDEEPLITIRSFAKDSEKFYSQPSHEQRSYITDFSLRRDTKKDPLEDRTSFTYQPSDHTNTFAGEASTTSRMNRAHYILRLATLFFSVLMITNVISVILIRLTEHGYSEKLIVCTTLVLLVLTAVFFCMYTIQRLHDCNRSGWYILIVLFPVIVFSYAYTANFYESRLKNMKAQQLSSAHAFASTFNLSTSELNKKMEELKNEKPKKGISYNQVYSDYKPLLILSYIINAILLLSLIILPGSKLGNRYGAPTAQANAIGLKELAIPAIIMFIATLGPLYLPDYLERKNIYDQAFFSIIDELKNN